MGQIADDMISEACCSQCGIYFVAEHGYPVVCSSCYPSNPDQQKATEEEV